MTLKEMSEGCCSWWSSYDSKTTKILRICSKPQTLYTKTKL